MGYNWEPARDIDFARVSKTTSSSRFTAMFRILWIITIAVSFPLALGVGEVRAQEDSALGAALALEKSLIDAISRAEPSVVAIARIRKEIPGEVLNLEFRPDPFGRRVLAADETQPTDPDFIPNEFATGVVVDPRGLILTTYHVLGDDSEYYITTHRREVHRARIKAADPRSDLAILAVDAVNLTPIEFGEADRLRKGQIVLALGNPYAIARDGEASAAWGIVANLARKAPVLPNAAGSADKSTLHHFGTLIQTDAKLNLGTSGGPLLDLRGRMVGLVTSIPAAAGYEQAAGYAIPVDETFRRVVDTLKQGREVEYGFLGIQPGNLMPVEEAKGLRGMRVERVQPGPGSPAVRGGLRPGDIITAVNGKPVHDADGLVLAVGRLPVDSLARLSVLREGRNLQLEVRLGKYPIRGKKIVTTRPDPWRGMSVDYTTVAESDTGLADRTYYDDGVLVTDVEEGTPAWNAGMRAGEVISHVGAAAVHTPKDFRSATAERPGPVQLRVFNDSGNLQRIVPPPRL